jgi:hypothetical protein
MADWEAKGEYGFLPDSKREATWNELDVESVGGSANLTLRRRLCDT